MNSTTSLSGHEALLHVSGPDALKFLQGQTTCDIRNVGPSQAARGVYCTPQGRVICDFLLVELGQDHCALRLRREIREPTVAVLAKYSVFSKVMLEGEREDWLVAGVCGANAADTLGQLFGSVPRADLECIRGENFVLVQTGAAGDTFECFMAAESTWPAALENAFDSLSAECWRHREISAGSARIEAATLGEFVPQVLNYTLTGHISFNKGCYTGQEVVARLHYRGRSKRRSFAFQLPAGAEAKAGDAVFDRAGKQVGSVINSACCDGDSRLLAATGLDDVEADLRLGTADGAEFTMLDMPYLVEA
ncbi:MAG: folate-binding protein YgfZ [Halioglobus sp.]|nr:folate-binding protein YgfZ [Halioglobus sp.]